jgi:putative addiction module component (TIGR02574 family)
MSETLRNLGIDRLSPDERLALIDEIWEILGGTKGAIPRDEAHLDEVRCRRDRADADPGAAIPWDEVQARLSRRP